MIKKLSSFASRAVTWVQESIRALVAALRRWFENTPTRKRLSVLGAAVAVAAVVGFLVAETAVGAILQTRSQTMLANEFAGTLSKAAGASGSSDLSPLPVDPPKTGEAVAIIKIPSIGLEQVVVEGQDTESLQHGPGHVPGTSLPGQPGNAAVVGRRTTFGAPFRNLSALTAGEEINVTTVEGSATYKVTDVSWRSKGMFEPAKESTLTLVTSGPRLLATQDLVARAQLVGLPLPPTPQNPRTYESPRSGDTGMWAQVLVWFVVIALVSAAAFYTLRRRWVPPTVVWLLSAPVVLACLLLAVRAIDTFLPATL
mgnify:FL=1